MIATHAGAVAGAWIYYLAIEVSFVADFDAVAIEIFFVIPIIPDQLAS